MEYYSEDFIGVYKNAFSNEYCDDVVKNFDAVIEEGIYSVNRQQSDGALKTKKDDTQLYAQDVFANASDVIETELSALKAPLGREFQRVFWEVLYPKYSEDYPYFKQAEHFTIYNTKLQKTAPGQGFHVWHYENANRSTMRRVLVFILYLNDVEEGGETEFLYQNKRISPEKGTLVLFPAYVTHVHRGNPPLSNNKYIYTGWLEY